MSIKSQLILYKSYKAKRFFASIPANGSDPSAVVVKVFTGKKPKVEVSLETGWFSGSRGFGGTSNRKRTFTQPNVVSLCQGVMANDAALGALLDYLVENAEEVATGVVTAQLFQRWWLLAQQENPCEFIARERRENAFRDKKFVVGDTVMYTNRSDYTPREVMLTGERFDWCPVTGGGWRFSFPGVDAPQSYFRKITQVEPALV